MNNPNQCFYTDILIIGSGIAGASAALEAAQYFKKVTLLTKEKELSSSNTYYAQGGIIYQGENDTPQKLSQDIFYAGAKINRPKAVEILSHQGPLLVKEKLIDTLKIPFATNKEGLLDLTEEGGHHVRRIIHYQDQTGKKIQESLSEALEQNPHITILKETFAVDLISSSHHSLNPLDIYEEPEILGVYALQQDKMIKILSKATILATGGMGNIYLHSSNPDAATGSGIAMAYRSGARIANMEYTQFHPTTLFHKDSNRFLISESVRGEGGVLVNLRGDAFMHRYHEMKDLAPRDVVTRAILTEMTENKENYVFLDLSLVGSAQKIKNRFPHIYQTCLNYNIDISKDPIPVVPAYHFSCGGVLTDTYGKTTLKRLFAVGETACTGLHGANRLASTSLLEGLTFGVRVSQYLEKNWDFYENCKEYQIPDWNITGHEVPDKALILQDWSFIKNIMWNYVGPIRNAKRISRALNDLNHLSGAIENFYRDCYPNLGIIELRNGVQAAYVVAMSAWKNKRSIGSHFREDA